MISVLAKHDTYEALRSYVSIDREDNKLLEPPLVEEENIMIAITVAPLAYFAVRPVRKRPHARWMVYGIYLFFTAYRCL